MPVTNDESTSVRWAILVLLFALAFVAYALRMNFAVVAELIMPEFGISKIQIVLGACVWLVVRVDRPLDPATRRTI